MKGDIPVEHGKWTIYEQTVEMAGEIDYAGIRVRSSGRWNGKMLNTVPNGNQISIATDNCFPRTAVVRVMILSLEWCVTQRCCAPMDGGHS